jgi:hypothetical protein
MSRTIFEAKKAPFGQGSRPGVVKLAQGLARVGVFRKMVLI